MGAIRTKQPIRVGRLIKDAKTSVKELAARLLTELPAKVRFEMHTTLNSPFIKYKNQVLYSAIFHNGVRKCWGTPKQLIGEHFICVPSRILRQEGTLYTVQITDKYLMHAAQKAALLDPVLMGEVLRYSLLTKF